MGEVHVTIEVGDPRGERFEPLEVMVDTGATFTSVPADLLRQLGVPVQETVQSQLADGSMDPIDVADTMIRLAGKQFQTPVIFGKTGEPNLLGVIALERALLGVDPVNGRLIPIVALRMANRPE